MTSPVVAQGFRLIEKESRVHAVDENGVEICGARQPYGHREWVVHTTLRLTMNNHQVIATTKQAAVEHVHHPLNQPCPECNCPKWLHTSHCVALKPRGISDDPCSCTRTGKDFR